jgi:hypothetical protein
VILLRTAGSKWQAANIVDFRNETELQALLYQSPELIPTLGESQSSIFIREAGLPGSGSTDLLGVDSSGNIMIVETKLAKNLEIRRKVIGQILEYAAYLWKMSYENFNQLFVSRLHKSILQMLSEKQPLDSPELLQQKIAAHLLAGQFHLLIAVDEINEELEKIIAYMSDRGGGVELEAIALKLYKHGNSEILVPQRYGNVLPPSEATSVRPTLSMAQIRANCPEDHCRALFALLEQEWTDLGHRIEPGTVGASFKADIRGQLHPIFWAYPESLQAAFGELEKRGAPPDSITEFRNVVSGMAGFDASKVLSKAQPIARLSDLSEESVSRFIRESQKIVESWRAFRAG